MIEPFFKKLFRLFILMSTLVLLSLSVFSKASTNEDSQKQHFEFLRGVLTTAQILPTLRDPYQKGGVGFLQCALIQNQNSQHNLVLVIGFPAPASDYSAIHEVSLQLDKVDSVSLKDLHILVTGQIYNVQDSSFTPATRKIKIKDKAGSKIYLAKPILEPFKKPHLLGPKPR